MGLGILPKAHRLLDVLAGIAIGWYRVRVDVPEPEQNPNAHYVRSAEDIRARIAEAENTPPVLSAYPAIYWASRLADGGALRVCDFGGGYGELYFKLRRHVERLHYTVTEIPEIVERASSLAFLSDVTFSTEPIDHCDLFISAGVVMNAHKPLLAAIEKLRPPAILLSSVEITDGPTYWSMVVMRKYGRRCPYITFNRAEFIGRIEAIGYTLQDEWTHGENTSGAFLNFQRNPIGRGFVFLRC